jgi:hypothetical protein
MDPTLAGMVVLAFTFGGAVIGNWLRPRLPAQHLGGETRDTVNLGVGLIATMTALVLGLITASAKSSFDEVDAAVKHSAAESIAFDRLLARYGPETREIRIGMQKVLERRIEMIWPTSAGAARVDLAGGAVVEPERLADAIRGLTPRDEAQRYLQQRALELAETHLQVRWVTMASAGTSVPMPFFWILILWLTTIFASFGLFAPRNGTALVALFVCALSVASAVFLILEMDGPFDGWLKISADPLRYAQAHLNR